MGINELQKKLPGAAADGDEEWEVKMNWELVSCAYGQEENRIALLCWPPSRGGANPPGEMGPKVSKKLETPWSKTPWRDGCLRVDRP